MLLKCSTQKEVLGLQLPDCDGLPTNGRLIKKIEPVCVCVCVCVVCACVRVCMHVYIHVHASPSPPHTHTTLVTHTTFQCTVQSSSRPTSVRRQTQPRPFQSDTPTTCTAIPLARQAGPETQTK